MAILLFIFRIKRTSSSIGGGKYSSSDASFIRNNLAAKTFQESKTLTIVPKKPFETMSEVDQFEEKLRSSSDLYNQLVS